MKIPNRLWLIPVSLILVLCLALVGVYYFVPVIQPCALLARVVPPQLLPPNPNVTALAFEPLPGARALTGEYACSGYRFEVPDNWNGDLIVYAHGFRAGASPQVYVTNLPVREDAIGSGFAWAASTYRQNGYNPLDGIEDTRMMLEQFKQRVGVPNQIFIYGSSMGGHVVVGSLEKYPEVYAGGLAECGAVGGAAQIDYLIAVNTLADYFAGTDMFAPQNRSLQAQLALVDNALYPALGEPPDYDYDENNLMGATEPSPEIALTPNGDAFRNSAIWLGGGPRPFAVEGFAPSYAIVLLAPRAIYALFPSLASVGTNQHTVYNIEPGLGYTPQQLNDGVRRIAADPAERARYAFTGNLQDPLLTLHDTGDVFVPIYNEQVYRRLADGAGKGDLLVQRAIRRFLHCDFSLLERNRAFDDLIHWVKNGVKPEGEDLLGSLENAGIQFTDPLRADDPGQLQ
jgi:dienelactone hydrolase